jgi:steroid 5-alpha reductase family enzyme
MSFLEIYLLAGVSILAINTALWLVSLRVKNSSIIDPFWSLLFLIAAIVYLALAEKGSQDRQLLLLALVAIWSLRLSLYLAWRNRGKGEDFRYRQWREDYGDRWWWRSFFQVFLLQGLLAWIISIPLLAAMAGESPAHLTVLDGLAVVVWLVSFFFEAVGDFQLARFRADPANKGRVLRTGVWRYTRHPNYFGEATQWWGYYLLALAAGGFWTIYAPLLMTVLLLRVSGVTLLEKTLTRTKPQYQDYIATTSAFVPWFPKTGLITNGHENKRSSL